VDKIITLAPPMKTDLRNDFIKKNEMATGLEFQYLPQEKPTSDLVNQYVAENGLNNSRINVALKLSHFRAWKQVVDKKLSSAIVLEDRVELEKDFKNLTEITVIPFIQQEHPDIILIDHCDSPLKAGKGLDAVPVANKMNCLHSYLVTYKGASKLLSQLYYNEDENLSNEVAQLGIADSVGYLNTNGNIVVWALRKVLSRQISYEYFELARPDFSDSTNSFYQELDSPAVISNADAKKQYVQ
jgi:hypothetical protein